MKSIILFFLFAFLFLTGFTATSKAVSSVSAELERFKTVVLSNPQNDGAYEELVQVLYKAGYLQGSVSELVGLIQSSIDPKFRQVYHRLGLALYDKGYDEYAAAILEIYEKGGISIPEAVKRVEAVLGQAKIRGSHDKEEAQLLKKGGE